MAFFMAVMGVQTQMYGETFTTPSVLLSEYDDFISETDLSVDRLCYLSAVINGKNVYINRGADWGTRGIGDAYGISVTCSALTDNNKSTIKFSDNQAYLFVTEASEVYADGAAYEWEFEAVEDGFYIKANGQYLSVNENGVLVLNDTKTIWRLINSADYDDLYSSSLEEQKLLTFSEAGFIVGNATQISGEEVYSELSGEFKEIYNNGNQINDDFKKNFYTHQLTGLENGLYKVSMQAFHRFANPTTVLPFYSKGYDAVTAYMYANDVKVQLKSPREGAQTESLIEGIGGREKTFEKDGIMYYIPDEPTSARAYFDKGIYTNEIYVYVSNGVLDFGFKNDASQGWWKEDWYAYGDIKVEKVEYITNPVIISNAGWATMMLPYKAEVPANMTVYSCDAVDENNILTLNMVNTIEANVPYIVAGEPGEYTFEGINIAKDNTYTSGLLTGVYAETPAPVGSYVLQNQTDGVAFYKVADVQPTVKANRAYLTLKEEAGVNVRAIYFPNGDADGVESVDAADVMVDVYTMSGIRVRSNVKKSEALNGLKGVYILKAVK